MKSSAMIAKCRDDTCGYAWIIAFLPMDMNAAGHLGRRSACPMCADRAPMLGKEADLHPTLLAHLRAFAPLRAPENPTDWPDAPLPDSQLENGGSCT